MTKKPLISGIIIFLNGEKFIEEAIESVFAQTYDNWELLLVDDGSTDGSTDIALRYVQKYPQKVRYLEHEGHRNCGMSASRNLGIRNARGEYVAFLDADDIWLPQKLERQLAILESHPEAGMVCGPTRIWYSWTGKPEDSQSDWLWPLIWPKGFKQLNGLYNPPTLLVGFLRHEVNTPTTCSALLRRKVFEKIGGFEESFRGMYEDYVFFSKVYLQIPVLVIGESWEKYRRHSNSHSHVALQLVQDSRHHPYYITYLNWLADYLTKKEVKDTKIWQAYQKELWLYQHPIFYRLQKTKGKLKQRFKGLLKLLAQLVLPISLRNWLGQWIRILILQKNIKHVFGLKQIDCSANDLIVLCIVRNGELYIKSFIEHYFSIGAKHIVFLDNESIDNTISIASNYESVTILTTKYKSPNYATAMKQYLAQQIAKKRWHLFAEIHELFDYPLLKQKCDFSESQQVKAVGN